MTEIQVPEIWKAGLALGGSEAGMGGRNMSNNPEAPTHPFPGLLPLRRICSVLTFSLFFSEGYTPKTRSLSKGERPSEKPATQCLRSQVATC